MRNLFLTFCVLGAAAVVWAQQMPPGHPAVSPATEAPATQPVDPNKVVLEAGDLKMTAGEFNTFVGALPEQIQAMARGPGKRMLAEKLVEIKLLAGEARKQGLDKQPKIITAIQIATEQTLAQAMAEKAATQTDDAALHAQYDKDTSQFDQLTARHILIRATGSPAPVAPGKKDLSEEEAKAKASELRDKIVNKKGDFAEIAKAESDDRGSAERGGDLGTFGKGVMQGPFEQAAYALKPGEVSEPVKTIFGYHLIQVQQRKTPSFDEVKAQQAGQQGGHRVDEFVKQLKTANPVKLDDAFFGAAMSKPAGHP